MKKLAALALIIAAAARAQEPPPLPRGPGLAARFPGDTGIERDPRVLLAESFEEGTLEDVSRRWEEVSNAEKRALALAEEAPPGGGKRALRITATPGRDTGGHLYRRLSRGVDTAYARFYVKFPEDAGYIHHFVTLGGYRPSTSYPQGGAGERPRGDDRVTVGIEPYGDGGRVPAPGHWNFYAYWHEMKVSADGRHWGNGLRPARPALVPRGKWQCVEVMLKLNSRPEAADGELALWLDGEPVAHFRKGARRGPWTGLGFALKEEGGEEHEGFRWRSSPELQVSFFWLLHYVTEGALRRQKAEDPSRPNPVLFDQVVVATEYIGPLAAPPAAK